MLITDTRHRLYDDGAAGWDLFRRTMRGGREYVDAYLEQYSSRESPEDFARRSKVTYNPAFAASALHEMRDAIYSRLVEIIRRGGSPTYKTAAAGDAGGVDLIGSSMDTFMGQTVLLELMSMGRMGVLVDAPEFAENATLADLAGRDRPYVSPVYAEDILNWAVAPSGNELLYTCVLVQERHPVVHEETGLPAGDSVRFRLMRLLPNKGGVEVRFLERYNPDKKDKTVVAEKDTRPPMILRKLTRLPFVHLDIGRSLLTDAALYQKALLNVASSDLAYILNANFPFYVEGYDPKADGLHNKDGVSLDDEGNEVAGPAGIAGGTVAVVGPLHGRRYPIAANVPAFIHPSSEPLQASMAKQEAMKDDIRKLLNLALSNVAPSRASAESKKADQVGLEAGLAGIGLELQGAENDIARIWAEFDGSSPATISYPTSYSLKSDGQRIEEAKGLKDLQGAAPSRLFGKEVAKLVVHKLLDGRTPAEVVDRIVKEIDEAKYATSDVVQVIALNEAGLMDGEVATEASGGDPERFKIAQDEHVQRLKDIAAAQSVASNKGDQPLSQARGVPGGVPDAKAEKTVSQAT